DHIREEYQIHSEHHVTHPFLHEKLEKKQQQSAFWRNPVVAWLWLHIPDLFGLIFLVCFMGLLWWGGSVMWHWLQGLNLG
ncbi:MAG: DUF4112 domain-containing protein, partial [Acinetobacter sp.]